MWNLFLIYKVLREWKKESIPFLLSFHVRVSIISAAVVLFIFNIHETNGKDSSFLLQFNIPSYSNAQKIIAFKISFKSWR